MRLLSRRAAMALAPLAIFTACSTTPLNEFTWPIPPAFHSVRMPDGYPLAFEAAGSGPPVVLIHGALTDSRSWAAQVAELSKNYRVINVNLRHYYPEPWNGKGPGFTLTQHADDIASLITALKLGQVHVVGHSRGGSVAYQVALRHPEVTRSLVLADPAFYGLVPETAETRQTDAAARAITERLQANYAKGDYEEAARDFVDSLSGPGTWAPRTPEQKKVFFDNLATGAAENIAAWPPARCEDVARLRMPVLLINGQNTLKRYIDGVRTFRECNPNAPAIVMIPNATHVMQRQQPGAFNAAVMGFLAQH